MKQTDRPWDWANIGFLTLSPLAAIGLAGFYIPHYGIRGCEIAAFVAMFFATGLSITAGYHRHFAHVTYKAHPLIRLFYLVFGACAMENSALNWAADHRLHHRYVDTDKDPYNAGLGFWYSHMGWIFYQTPKDRDFTMVGDLMRDRLVRWQHRHHVAIALGVGFAIPAAIGCAIGRPVGMLLWAGLIRVVFVHHMTFFINSLAHMYGTQPYSRSDTSRDSWWLALLTNGEGYHNFHHRFPSDYRNGIRWYQWDPTKWLIAGLHWMGATDRLHRIPSHLILKARMDVEASDAEKRLQDIAHDRGAALRAGIDAARLRLEQALAQWAESRARYWEFKKAAWQGSERVALRQWKYNLRDYERRLSEAREHWKTMLQSLQRVSVSIP
ncbi:MAG TPA: fatty acid desaturase [Elusimicrobiota bacterium]|nr:fatty acid desaturase [Elusimicrobiota bacterium]